MKKAILIFSAAVLSGCGGDDNSSSDTKVRIPSQAKEKSALNTSDLSAMLFTHRIIDVKPNRMGGSCLFEGNFTNGGNVPLFMVTLSYNINHAPLQLGEPGIMGQEKSSSHIRISADEYRQDPIIQPGDVRDLNLEVKGIECERLRSFEVKAFGCKAASADGKMRPKALSCTKESLLVDNQTEVTFTTK